MSEIKDFGKIWLLGYVKPEYGVRVNDRYFVVGEGDAESPICGIYGNYLLVFLNFKWKKVRLFRKFPLDLKPKSQGTLFNGFIHTKHANVIAATYRDIGVGKFVCDKEDSFLINSGEIDLKKVMELAGWE